MRLRYWRMTLVRAAEDARLRQSRQKQPGPQKPPALRQSQYILRQRDLRQLQPARLAGAGARAKGWIFNFL